MSYPKQLLLITTTRQAIAEHLANPVGTPPKNWLILPERQVPLADYQGAPLPGRVISLVDESAGLYGPEEDAIEHLMADREVHWVKHNYTEVIDVPHHRVLHLKEHSQTGSIAAFFFSWRSTTEREVARRYLLLRNYLKTSRQQAVDLLKKSYLNRRTAVELARLAKKYSHPEELNYVEKQLLELYPLLVSYLQPFVGEQVPERVHHFRLALANYFYPPAKSN